MKKTTTLIVFTLFLNLSFAQDYIPIHIDSLIHTYKSYQTIKWTQAEVEELDSIYRPQYYKGGVLVFLKKEKYRKDTIYISDVTGVSREKFHTMIASYSHKNNQRINPYFFENDCLTPQGNQTIFGLRSEVLPLVCHPTTLDFELKKEHSHEYPNGLPKKVKTFTYSLPNITSLTWEEWKLKEKHRTNQKVFSDFVYTDSEGNLYYPYPPGYYSDYNCTTITSLAIQKALRKRGYEVDVSGKFSNKTKAALSQFQKDNGLPSCGGEHLWLEILGIKHK